MTDLEQQDPADAASSLESQPSLGKNIVRSFKNRSKRMTSEEPELAAPLDETAPMSPTEVAAEMSAPEPYVPASAPDSYLPVETSKPVSVALVTPPAETKKPPRPKTRHSRRARLRISRIDPWSVMKTALLFSIAGWIIFIVATWVVFTVLDQTGLYGAINDTVAQIFATDNSDTFNIQNYVNTTRATAVAALVGAVNVVILTALATIFAFLYNLSAVVMGGIEVTMAED